MSSETVINDTYLDSLSWKNDKLIELTNNRKKHINKLLCVLFGNKYETFVIECYFDEAFKQIDNIHMFAMLNRKQSERFYSLIKSIETLEEEFKH